MGGSFIYLLFTPNHVTSWRAATVSTRYSTASICRVCIRLPTQILNSYTGMLPSGCAVLYYLFDVQLFLQPQWVRKRGQHGSGVNWCVASLDAMAAGMWHILHPAHMRAITLCENCVLSLPVNLFTVLTYPTHPTAYPRNGLAARYGEKLSDKVRTILKL